MTSDAHRSRSVAGRAAAVTLLAALASVPAQAADCDRLAGQYFFDVQNPKLAAALKASLGEAYQRFDERYQVQVPFEVAGDGYVYAAACMPHACTVEEAFLGVETATCKVFVALLEDSSYTLTTPENGWPEPLEAQRQAWMSR